MWFFAVVPNSAYGQGVTDSTQNPNQIAILHWYNANRTTSFPVPGSDVAFDGENIWISTGSDPCCAVAKLQANSGLVIGTYAVGSVGGALAFDMGNF